MYPMPHSHSTVRVSKTLLLSHGVTVSAAEAKDCTAGGSVLARSGIFSIAYAALACGVECIYSIHSEFHFCENRRFY
jgi:hypothetical protein